MISGKRPESACFGCTQIISRPFFVAFYLRLTRRFFGNEFLQSDQPALLGSPSKLFHHSFAGGHQDKVGLLPRRRCVQSVLFFSDKRQLGIHLSGLRRPHHVLIYDMCCCLPLRVDCLVSTLCGKYRLVLRSFVQLFTVRPSGDGGLPLCFNWCSVRPGV